MQPSQGHDFTPVSFNIFKFGHSARTKHFEDRLSISHFLSVSNVCRLDAAAQILKCYGAVDVCV